MERFKVTGAELREFYKSNVELARVFYDIESDLRTSDSVVCRYIVNGLEISEDDEVRFGSVSLEQIETLEYQTENNQVIVKSVLRGWIEALPELMDQTEHLCNRVRVQGFQGHLKAISDLVENCEFLIDSVISLKVLLGNQYLIGCPTIWINVEAESKKAVLQALQALENKNFVLLADVLEYDLNNVLQMWLDKLQHLESLVLGKSTNGEHTGSNISNLSGHGMQLGGDGAGFSSFANQIRPNSMGRKRFAN
jgi:hypothetical protein